MEGRIGARMLRMMAGVLLALTSACVHSQVERADAAVVEDVRFDNEGVTLAGSLWLPAGPGPHPAMVFVHGAGRASRQDASGLADYFQSRGIAVLGYDKRGVGESGGVYVGRRNASEANLTLLARDAVAGIKLLRGHESIDPEQIGLWGLSQAGWIVPIAAVIDGEVRFTILRSGPTVTVGEELYYSDLTGDDTTRRAALSQQEISRLLAERGPSGFDPIPYLKQMDMPGLWLFGSADESIPIPETIAHLDDLVDNYGRDFTYRVWQGADHGLRVNGQRVPGFWSVQHDFLFQRVGVKVR